VSDERQVSSNFSGKGGEFVVARRSILSRFALPWLLELHDLDPILYDRIAFETCLEVSNEKVLDVEHQHHSNKQV
jgi:hypothetical protein